MIRSAPVLALLLLTACVEDLAPPSDDTDDSGQHHATDDTDTEPDAPVVFGDDPESADATVAAIDATSSVAWVHLDLDTPAWTEPDGAWSLAFQRYVIALNGGVSGDAGVEAVFAPDLAFDRADEPPEQGWLTDAPDADDDGEPERAFDAWYDYDPESHVLTPRPGTWFVRGASGGTWAVQILDYYSDAGDSGYPRIRFRRVDDAD